MPDTFIHVDLSEHPDLQIRSVRSALVKGLETIGVQAFEDDRQGVTVRIELTEDDIKAEGRLRIKTYRGLLNARGVTSVQVDFGHGLIQTYTANKIKDTSIYRVNLTKLLDCVRVKAAQKIAEAREYQSKHKSADDNKAKRIEELGSVADLADYENSDRYVNGGKQIEVERNLDGTYEFVFSGKLPNGTTMAEFIQKHLAT